MRKYLFLLLLLCLHIAARGQTIADIDLSGLPQPTQAKAIRYWFDDDGNSVQTINQVSGKHTLDVSSLLEGLHTLHVQVIDNENAVTYVHSNVFLKVAKQTSTTETHSLRYWFDDDVSSTTIVSANASIQSINTTSLKEGVHTIHCQVIDADNIPSYIASSIFLKTGNSGSSGVVSAKKLFYWYDDETNVKTIDYNGGIQMLDVSNLNEGVHTIHYQVLCSNGQMTPTASSIFLRVNIDMETTVAKSVRYWFDDDDSSVMVSDIGNGIHSLDVSNLFRGIHILHYQLIDNEGKLATPVSRIFLKNYDKVFVGENLIIMYQYWLNDDYANVHTVTIDNAANPYQLIDMLPMPKVPIRESCFHFEMTDGVPTMYAKNTLHFRFHDAQGYFVDNECQFIDYSIKQEIADIDWLESGVRATTPKPTGDDVKWYKVSAVCGDSLQFKLDRAATIQLFAPSGEEVYKASGAESVAWGGCHAKENGTFYVAIHDVTAKQGTTISVDYNHIDKYAIFTYTPTKMSSKGTTIMDIKGNGLEFVKSVELLHDNTILRPDTIVKKSSEMSPSYSLNYELNHSELFDLKIVFDNEGDNKTIIIPNAITLEPINKGEISVFVSSERRVGDPYPIKVTLKNDGNLSYYGIPVNVAFDYPEMLDEFLFVNFDLLLSESLYNNRMFFTYTDNLVGTGKKGFFMPLLIPYLGPNEERTYVFGVKTKTAHAKFNFYAWAGEPIYDGLNENNSKTTKYPKRRGPCEGPSNIPDVYDVLDNTGWPGRVLRPFIGLGEAIAGIIQGSTRMRDEASLKNANIDPSEWDNYGFTYRNCPRSAQDILNDAHPLQIKRKASNTRGGSSIDTNASSNCPPPQPHPIDVYIPGDPNDITGYVSESGSHYMTDEIINVSYDIEFENNPELANSSAHSIIIENQLDPKVFNLNSFVPNDITISNEKIELNGEKSFVKTIDLRNRINVIAEIRCDYNEQSGKITWTFTSLDPLTMEPTYDIEQGVLPINNELGEGIGHVNYSVDLIKGLRHGTNVNNKASIIFDFNDPIETSTWTNVIDKITPESRVIGVELLNDSTASVSIEANDDGSGPWRYDVYVQYGEGSGWWRVAENVPIDTTASVKVYDGINHGFYVLVTDSAGNMEKKEPVREFVLDMSDPNAIEIAEFNGANDDSAIYDLQGRRIEKSAIPKKGIYIVTGRRSKAQKVMRH